MIINWVLRSAILTIILALILHCEISLPSFLSWIGDIPGDTWLKDVGRKVNFPIASAALISTVLSLILPAKK